MLPFSIVPHVSNNLCSITTFPISSPHLQAANKGEMGRQNVVVVWVAVLAVLSCIHFTPSHGKANKTTNLDAASTHYEVLPSNAKTGQERVLCQARGSCHNKILQCPTECTQRKPRKNKKVKGCFVDCSSKCEATCKHRKPNCNGYGSVCCDPRFVGGDGVMFYFHGAKGGDFALVSDEQLQINAHFIGSRPEGRSRDFTWVQALAVMFDNHTLIVSADRVTKWDDSIDCLSVIWDGEKIAIPTDGEAEWRIASNNEEGREVVVERTDETNSAKVTIAGLVEMNVKVTPIGKEDNRIHNCQLPEDDAFAHLEMQFKFTKLTDIVEGVLGQTYRPGYVSPVRTDVPMPMMGGEDRYRTSSLLSTDCPACRFQRPLPPIEITVSSA